MNINEQLNSHLRELHGFVDNIMGYGTEPANWPLTQQEQAAFVRTVIYQANKIRKSQGYIATAVMLAAEDLTLSS